MGNISSYLKGNGLFLNTFKEEKKKKEKKKTYEENISTQITCLYQHFFSLQRQV